MVIDSLTLTNFCGFERFRLKFGALNVLVGPNNGGKTTVLRAVRMVFDALDITLGAFISSVRAWDHKALEIKRHQDEVVANGRAAIEKRRREVEAQVAQLGDVPRAQRYEALDREDNSFAEGMREERQRVESEHLRGFPKWQCELAQLVQRQSANSVTRFLHKHNPEASATLEMVLLGDGGALTLRLEISSAKQAAITVVVDNQELRHLGAVARDAVLVALQRVQCMFVQPIGNLSPSERSISWPEVQEQMARGKEHDVWRNRLHWLAEGKSPEAHQRVIARVQESLGGIRVKPPGRTREQNPSVVVTYEENGDEYDLAEAGSGLRTLLGVASCLELSDASVLLFDEPDAHLHSSIQRQLADFLESHASNHRQIVVATHSPDMLDRFPLESLVWIDRSAGEGRDCGEIGKIMVDLGALSHKDALESAQADRFLYFEAKPDKKAYELLIQRCGLNELLTATTVAQLRGTGDIQHLPAVARVMRAQHNRPVAIAVIRDADYTRAAEAVNEDGNVLVLSLPCKEIENLLLLQPVALVQAFARAAERRREFTGRAVRQPTLVEVDTMIDAITQSVEIRRMVENNWIVSRLGEPGVLDAGRLGVVRDEFETFWADPALRRRYSPGKEVLRKLRKRVQDEWHLSTAFPFEQYVPDAEVVAIFGRVQTHYATVLNPPA